VLTKLKAKIQQLLVSEASAAHKIGFTPNMISIMGFGLSILAAWAYAAAGNSTIYLLVATVLLLSSGFCDTLDGVLARTFKLASAFGGFLDSLLDRYADAFVYAGILFSGLCNNWWVIAALLGSLLVSYSRARAEAAGVKMESIGIAERAERIIILCAASLLAIYWAPFLNIAIILLAVLSNLTVLQRVLHFYRTLKNKERTTGV
jgi:archaetidylinositol phosphate synthase